MDYGTLNEVSLIVKNVAQMMVSTPHHSNLVSATQKHCTIEKAEQQARDVIDISSTP